MIKYFKAKIGFLLFYKKNKLKENRKKIQKLYPSFVPRGRGGDLQNYLKITNLTINNIFPSINNLLKKKLIIENIEDIKLNDLQQNLSEDLKRSFNLFGSDKSFNNYHLIYSQILENREKKFKIIEIGIGSNSKNVLGSTIGDLNIPGGSLRAFKDVFLNSQIYGADIDDQILFEEDRIFTTKLDQLSLDSFEELKITYGGNFDLIIDDGLHSVLANINTINYAIFQLKNGGYIVIEDVHEDCLPVWEALSNTIKDKIFSLNLYKIKDQIFTIKMRKIL